MSIYVIVDDSDQGIDYAPIVNHAPGTATSGATQLNGWFVGGKGMYYTLWPMDGAFFKNFRLILATVSYRRFARVPAADF